MANFCIPKQLSAQLKEAAKTGEINVKKLFEMESSQRRKVFEKYTNKEIAREINGGFEEAMISKQKDALRRWAIRTFNATDKKSPKYKDVLDKINTLSELGVLNSSNSESFLSDLVATKLGASISEAEVKTIHQKAEKLESLAKEKTEFGTPTTEYFRVKKDVSDYIDSITPSSRLKVFTSTIARGSMLFSIKSPVTNIIGNSAQAIYQSFERRLTSLKIGGLNNDYARRYVKYVNDIYSKTGYDVSRMISFDNVQETLGEQRVHSQGKGVIRTIGRFYEDLVFNKLMGAPDVMFSSVHFADSANIASTKIAESEGLVGAAKKKRALEIFKDATNISPESTAGEIVRSQAMADAMYSTFTNDSVYSKFALAIRKAFNDVSGDLRIGDQLMPFVKTPANVIGAGLDAGGVGAITSTYKLVFKGAYKEILDGDYHQLKDIMGGYVKTGLGLSIAFILTSLLKPEDFVGEFPITEKERELLRTKNATANSILIGGKWISLDYFGPIAAPFVGMLYAKKYGNGLTDSIFKYGQGVVLQSLKIPGLSSVYDTYKSIKENRPDKSKSFEENLAGVGNMATDFIRARTIPAIVSDIAKATDSVERETNVKKDSLAKVKASIPGLRQSLPVKKDVFADDIKTEDSISTLLFGSRVKTNRENELINELGRLADNNMLPSITNIEKSSSRAQRLNAQIGDKEFSNAKEYYGKNLKDELMLTVNSDEYKDLNDEDKKKMIEDIKGDMLEDMLAEYNYEEPEEE